ncbi:hypothetical protein ACNUDN_05395 [Mycobacterium sp. smrl_JER01]
MTGSMSMESVSKRATRRSWRVTLAAALSHTATRLTAPREPAVPTPPGLWSGSATTVHWWRAL